MDSAVACWQTAVARQADPEIGFAMAFRIAAPLRDALREN
jgi:hypothetical protein